jgi:transketolase
MTAEVDQRSIDTLRFLSVDMVEAARSGHPGLPLGAAPMAYVLWTRHLRHSPRQPRWPDRDRFVLSAGHGSALLYSLLHLSGYDLPLEELRRFRQWGSRTPGHPEAELTEGVEVTTGPLGQGFAMGVGLAIAERTLARRFNRPGLSLFDHWTYALVSDGDLMEGISSEAASLAGTLGLGRLVYLYDSNRVSLEGATELSFTEDVLARFRSYGWSVERLEDGNDVAAIDAALRAARADERRPHLIEVRTHIGFGSPKQDTKDAHGEPLGAAGARSTKEKLGWPTDPPFLIPEEVREHFSALRERGARWAEEWEERHRRYGTEFPELASELDRALAGDWGSLGAVAPPEFGTGELATREASAQMLNALARAGPMVLGGSADLAPSTKTLLTGESSFQAAGGGRNLHFGVREHAMAAAVNGMAMHGGVLPYGSTFLVFSDYMRPALRLGSIMRAHGLFVFTHDSVGLGEDGPTHQPIEQLWSLRAIPGFTLLRPADAWETAAAWRVALGRTGPVALVLTRQKVPTLSRDAERIARGVPHGGYALRDPPGRPEIVLLATGSEVHLALAAAEELAERAVAARVVSLPSVEIFDEQSAEYRAQLLPPGVPRLAIEAGSAIGWWKYVGADGDALGIERFGASAPGPEVLAHLGFTVEHVLQRVEALLARRARDRAASAGSEPAP